MPGSSGLTSRTFCPRCSFWAAASGEGQVGAQTGVGNGGGGPGRRPEVVALRRDLLSSTMPSKGRQSVFSWSVRRQRGARAHLRAGLRRVALGRRVVERVLRDEAFLRQFVLAGDEAFLLREQRFDAAISARSALFCWTMSVGSISASTCPSSPLRRRGRKAYDASGDFGGDARVLHRLQRAERRLDDFQRQGLRLRDGDQRRRRAGLLRRLFAAGPRAMAAATTVSTRFTAAAAPVRRSIRRFHAGGRGGPYRHPP